MKDKQPRFLQIDHDRNVGFNKKYTTIAIYVILVLLFAAALIYLMLSPERLNSLLDTLSSIFTPILIGLVIAYLLYPIYRFFEKKVYISAASRRKLKCRRALYNAKLRYDFERREHADDKASVKAAAKAYAEARVALAEATVARAKERAEQQAKHERRFAAKRRHPSFVKQAPPEPFQASKTLALITTYLIFLLLITLFVWMIVPPCLESIGDLLLVCRDFLASLPDLFTSFELGRQIRDLLNEFGVADDIKMWIATLSLSLFSWLTSLVDKIPAMLYGLVSNLTNILLGIFFSVYFLSSRKMLFRQLKKLVRALFSRRTYSAGRHLFREIDRKFGKFIQGKLTSSAILGVLSFILFWITGIPYFQMITLIVTVTNLIPFFGPFIGAIPSGIIILISAPDKLIIFIILVLILQQIEGNILEPRILGDSLGLEPVWIMVAIVVMGELFGIIGMVLGVPLFAVIFTLISEFCDRRLKKKQS